MGKILIFQHQEILVSVFHQSYLFVAYLAQTLNCLLGMHET